MEESDSGVNVAVEQEVGVDLGLMSENSKQSEGAELVSGPRLCDPLGSGLCPQSGAFPDDAGELGLGPRMDRDNKERLEAMDRDNKERLEAMDKDNKERDRETKERLEANKEIWEAMDKGNKEGMRKLHTVIDERLSAVNNRLDEGEKNLDALKQVCVAVKEKAIENDITERRDVLPDERIKEIVEDLLADKQGALDSVEAQVTRQEAALNKHRDEVAEEEIQTPLQFKEAQLEVNRKHREELAQLQLACSSECETPPGRSLRESEINSKNENRQKEEDELSELEERIRRAPFATGSFPLPPPPPPPPPLAYAGPRRVASNYKLCTPPPPPPPSHLLAIITEAAGSAQTPLPLAPN
ncbi:arp2/3 complex-activating protein rickA-like [Schistocerca gregaria]|uniref:arp2/3 complex-activating protein rickA-like n=1 Tax=Schistocerca gregaria TaxID=7010 RepID=UPI00211ECC0E|nr:arp2/3 complex-activating protein rickA-like [Schistocerca gregaria]